MVAAKLLLEAGVTFLYNSVGGVLVDDQNRLCGVVTANKAGLQAVIAKVVIDATPAGQSPKPPVRVASRGASRRCACRVRAVRPTARRAR